MRLQPFASFATLALAAAAGQSPKLLSIRIEPQGPHARRSTSIPATSCDRQIFGWRRTRSYRSRRLEAFRSLSGAYRQRRPAVRTGRWRPDRHRDVKVTPPHPRCGSSARRSSARSALAGTSPGFFTAAAATARRATAASKDVADSSCRRRAQPARGLRVDHERRRLSGAHRRTLRRHGCRESIVQEPSKSLLLLKPSMAMAHGGGLKLPKDSDDYRTILEWVENGRAFRRRICRLR